MKFGDRRGAPLHSFAAFRTGQNLYRHRPEHRHNAARLAWDILAQRGPIISLELVAGEWRCRRSDIEFDYIEAAWIRQALTNPTDAQQEVIAAIRALPPCRPPEAARTLARQLRQDKLSMRAIAVRLAQAGFPAPSGKPYPVQCIRVMLGLTKRRCIPKRKPMDELATLCRRLTYNGASNLRRTIERPHAEHPDAVNGGERLYTGLGKYTTLAHIGVENHLMALNLAEWRDKWFCVTPLGRQVAQYLHDNWDAVSLTFRR